MRVVTAPIPNALNAAATMVERAAAHYMQGALALEATDVTVEQWRPRFDAAIRDLSTPWRAADAALADARTAVAGLDQSDARASAALARIEHGQAYVRRGYDYAARTMMGLPNPLTREFARMALGRIGAAGRSMNSVLVDAAAAIRLLALTNPA